MRRHSCAAPGMVLGHPPDPETDFAVGIDHCTSRIGAACTGLLLDLKAAASSLVATHHASRVTQEACGVGGFTEFTRLSRRGERLRSCRAQGQTSRWISVSIAKARIRITKNPTRNVGLIANIRQDR